MSEQHLLLEGARWRASTSTGTNTGSGAGRPVGVLMTATLRPPAAAVARSDPNDRLNDYLDALRFYLDTPDAVVNRILFVDNSASDLGPLQDLVRNHAHGKRVELISFSGNDHPPERGKAYGEFKLMDHGLKQSTLFQPR